MPAGGGAATVFLDIRSRVRAGGEQGLLGLAFHPSYSSNRRFFVYYTRAGDGAIVVAEYAASPANPDTADSTERVLLTIPHPSFTNHNGGMVAFGPDGYLYIGVGDGGSGNDPPNNAQNKNVLLGKLLRIDVDRQSGSLPYAIPLSNPFAGLIDGRDEIFAYGLRNPWRFAFDRQTSQLWIADVGQGDREEVNTPIQHGGNYGWRVFEGSACTNIDRALCVPSNYLSPIFDYGHTNGRCSITGGYVYRGSLNALSEGLYVYGDFCTGEILTWNGAAQQVVLDTSLSISSFGEDDAGEIYVVALEGVVSRLTGAGGGGVVCAPTISGSELIVSRAGESDEAPVPLVPAPMAQPHPANGRAARLLVSPSSPGFRADPRSPYSQGLLRRPGCRAVLHSPTGPAAGSRLPEPPLPTQTCTKERELQPSPSLYIPLLLSPQ